MVLTNRKILLFAPDFFGYDIAIKEKLESLGATVYLYNERPSSNIFIKAIIRLYKKSLHFYCKRYFFNILQKHKEIQFDYVFVIKGEVINKDILKIFKENFKSAKFLLYLWDSILNYKDTKEALPFYDSAFTFDKNDAEQFSILKFRPLFYIDNFNNVLNKKIEDEIDLLFIGTVHSDRWVFLNKIERQNINKKVFIYPYIQSPLIFLFRKIFDKKLRTLPISKVKFKSLSKECVADLICKSKIIIDIQHPNQSGLTMRAIEIFGMKKKLITTNKTIANYDFYSPNNILIISRSNPMIPEDFFNSTYIELEEEIYRKYSIEGWILEIFEN